MISKSIIIRKKQTKIQILYFTIYKEVSTIKKNLELKILKSYIVYSRY